MRKMKALKKLLKKVNRSPLKPPLGNLIAPLSPEASRLADEVGRKQDALTSLQYQTNDSLNELAKTIAAKINLEYQLISCKKDIFSNQIIIQLPLDNHLSDFNKFITAISGNKASIHSEESPNVRVSFPAQDFDKVFQGAILAKPQKFASSPKIYSLQDEHKDISYLLDEQNMYSRLKC
jgi:hypothetical protein